MATAVSKRLSNPLRIFSGWVCFGINFSYRELHFCYDLSFYLWYDDLNARRCVMMKESKRRGDTLFLGTFFIGGGKPASSLNVNNHVFVVQNQRKREAIYMAFVSFF